MKTDILIIGSGCSGLYCALHLPKEMQVTVITKSDLESSDSFLAQGGICMLRDELDYADYFEDTMRAGHYENDKTSVEIMIRSSKQVIEELLAYGVDFQREKDGGLAFTKEGAHSRSRILFHKDITGKEITKKLLAQVKKCSQIQLLEYTTMLDIITKDNSCYGAVVRKPDGEIAAIEAAYTVFATGGIGGLYEHSTNFRHLTGDAVAAALRHKVAVQNMNYIQIHPTTFYTPDKEERRFLISESVRGEGALLCAVLLMNCFQGMRLQLQYWLRWKKTICHMYGRICGRFLQRNCRRIFLILLHIVHAGGMMLQKNVYRLFLPSIILWEASV